MAAPHHLILSPHGRLLLEQREGDVATSAFAADDELTGAFAKSSAHGLLVMAARRRDAACLRFPYPFVKRGINA